MPFVTNEHREKPDPSIPGDLCFTYYKPLVDGWNKERRWTTWHNMCRDLFQMTDDQTAKFSAAIEFYIRHVHKYEDEKEQENGKI